jgi:2-(1,2-epoxy-1,2-dihydrophenyl)acetyl-CoA isomerase
VEALQVERDGGIVTVTLNKPEKKNAVDPAQWAEMARIWDDIARNPRRDRAVVVTGAGGDFCSGADLWLPPGEEPPHQVTAMRSVAKAIQGLHELPQPTIAKVPGVAAGAGFSLALGCDLVVAGEAARFSMVFAKRGLALDGGASWLLPRLLNDSYSRTLQEALEAEGMAQSITLASKDTAEAIASFMEKRDPTFHGR